MLLAANGVIFALALSGYLQGEERAGSAINSYVDYLVRRLEQRQQHAHLLDGVVPGLPSLLAADKLQEKAVVRIIDDDDSMRKSWRFLIEGEGWTTKCYSSALRFLEEDDYPENTGQEKSTTITPRHD